MTKEKTIENELFEAGRLNQVLRELKKLHCLDITDYPVYFQYNRNGELVTRVAMKRVMAGALVYLATISIKENELELSEEELEALDALNMFFNSKLEICMHNYANSCAHRDQPTETEIEYIRILSVLVHSIRYLALEFFKDEDFNSFDIPEGWKRQNK